MARNSMESRLIEQSDMIMQLNKTILCLQQTIENFHAKEAAWCSVKKKYKLNVNFFHNTIFNQQLILNPLTLSNTYPHIHLVRDNHNGCVF